MPDESLSLARGRHRALGAHSATSPYYQQTLEALARAYRQPMTKPWKDLPKEFRDVVLYGSGEDEITFTYDDGVRRYSTAKPFEGVINNIERRWRETEVRVGDARSCRATSPTSSARRARATG